MGVQMLGGLGAYRISAIGSRTRGQALLMEHSIPSGLGLTGHEAGVKPCPTSACHSPPPQHQDLPAPPGASAVALLLRAWKIMPLLQLSSFCGHNLSPRSLGNEQWSRAKGPSSASAPASPWEQADVSLWSLHGCSRQHSS